MVGLVVEYLEFVLKGLRMRSNGPMAKRNLAPGSCFYGTIVLLRQGLMLFNCFSKGSGKTSRTIVDQLARTEGPS